MPKIVNSLIKSLPTFFSKPITLAVALVLSVAAAGGSYYLYQNSQAELAKIKSDPRAITQEEVKALVAKVGALVALPEGEEPTVATVTDKERLKDQPFFARAENGDKVIIYTQAKKAYLYSVVMNKILEIAPVNIGTGSGAVAGEKAEPTKKPTPTPTKKSPKEVKE